MPSLHQRPYRTRPFVGEKIRRGLYHQTAFLTTLIFRPLPVPVLGVDDRPVIPDEVERQQHPHAIRTRHLVALQRQAKRKVVALFVPAGKGRRDVNRQAWGDGIRPMGAAVPAVETRAGPPPRR